MAITSGTVVKVMIHDIPESKQKQDRYGKVSTHRYSFLLKSNPNDDNEDGMWFSAGQGDKPVLNVEYEGDWKPLGEGSEIMVKYQTREVNGKKYNNTKRKDISVDVLSEGKPFDKSSYGENSNNKSAASPSQTQVSSGYSKPYVENTGMLAGHAIKCAYAINSKEDKVALAKKFMRLSKKLKEEYAKDHPDTSKRNVGETVGMAILTAAPTCKDLKEVWSKAKNIAYNESPSLIEFAESLSNEVKEEPPAKSEDERGLAEEFEEVLENSGEDSTPSADDLDADDILDFDDDIPFS